LSFGGISVCPLIRKLVKPIKVTRSRPTNELGFDHRLIFEAESEMGAADAAVLREANAAVRQKPARLDLGGSHLDQLAELLPVFLGD